MRRARLAAVLAVGLGSLLLGVPAASATFHLMNVREVYPGSVANPAAQYVELQMWAAGQNHVAGEGKVLHIFGPDGKESGQATFPADVPDAVNQSTLVLATPQAAAQFGFTADAELPPGALSPAGGKVCWVDIDCVVWGSFAGSSTVPSPAGNPAAPAGIPDGMALRRTIAPGCPTLLEPGDDTNESIRDFFVTTPDPRPNSVPPTEVSCGGPEPVEPAQPPRTSLRRKPHRRTHDRTPTFAFASDVPGSHFECSLDRHRFHGCRSPLTTRRLTPGLHRFSVRAVDVEGDTDRTPASFAFLVLPRRR